MVYLIRNEQDLFCMQRAMVIFFHEDEEFCSLFEENPKSIDDSNKKTKSTTNSNNNNNINQTINQFAIEEAKPEEEQEFPSFSNENNAQNERNCNDNDLIEI